MASRGFIGKISRWFSGPSDTYFFGVQIAIKCFGEDTIRARFARVLEDARNTGDSEDVQEKRRFIRRFVALLEESDLFWTYGYWDYIDEAAPAAAEFNSWVSDIESSLAVEAEELSTEVDDLRRTSSRKEYVIVTMAFLMDQPYGPAEEVTNEDAYFLKETFAAFVKGLNTVDPRAIQADAAYIVPGNAEDGLSEDDLYSPGWEYLRMLL